MSLSQRKRKSIVDAEARLRTNDVAGPGNLRSGQVNNFEPRLYQSSLLFGGKAQELVLEERIGNEDLKREAKEFREKRGLAQIDETACITDYDPHLVSAVPSGRPPPEAMVFSATRPPY